MKKVILLTGASDGIGKDLALSLAKDQGYIVYAGARRTEMMQDFAGLGVHALHLDVTDPEGNKACIERIISEQGRIDILINNAGYGEYGTVEEVNDSKAKKQFEVNIFGLMDLTRRALPHMRAARSGRIINITSIARKISGPCYGWYAATKHALAALSDAMRIELRDFNIDIIQIEPGTITTGFGAISRENLLKNQHIDDYEDLNNIFTSAAYKVPAGHVKESTKVITRAIKTKKPKTRYIVTKLGHFLMFLKLILPDQTFDNIFIKRIKESKEAINP